MLIGVISDTHDRLPMIDAALGVFRKRVEPELEFAIYISRDRGGRRWLAGNGRSPLAAFLAPNEHSGVADAVSAEQ